MGGRLMPPEHKNGPTQRARDQGAGGLVDVQIVLKGNEKVTENENENEQSLHGENISSDENQTSCSRAMPNAVEDNPVDSGLRA